MDTTYHFAKTIRTNNIKNGIEKIYSYCIEKGDPYVWATVKIQSKKYYVVCEGWTKECLVGFKGLKDAHRSSLEQFRRMNLKHVKTVWKSFPGYSDGISIDIFVKK